MAKDYTSTLNLPKTDFQMRASLPQREPEMLKTFEKKDLYKNMLKKRASPPSCCTTALPSLTATSIWVTP